MLEVLMGLASQPHFPVNRHQQEKFSLQVTFLNRGYPIPKVSKMNIDNAADAINITSGGPGKSRKDSHSKAKYDVL